MGVLGSIPAGPKLLALFLAIRPGAFFLSNCRQNCRSVTRVNRNRNRHRGGGGGGWGGGTTPPHYIHPCPVPRGGTRGREMPPYLCVWGARATGGCGAWTGWAARHAGPHGSAAPGPAPDLSVTRGGGGGGFPGLGSTPCTGPWGGGLAYLCLPYTGTTRGRHGVSAACH